jgi:hypothetical protein
MGEYVKDINNEILVIYTTHNKDINVFKTKISPIAGDWYCGMVFLEPSVQLLEAEKNYSMLNTVPH